MQTMRVVLVDDHHVVRRGLESFLSAHPDIEVVGSAESGEALLEHLDVWLPDVIVMDLNMPGGMTGIEATQRAKDASPHTKIVVLTAHTDDNRVVAALRSGATGYIRKESDPDVLLDAIRAAVRGQSVLDPSIAQAVLDELTPPPLPANALTPRERDVLDHLVHGRSNKEIADELVVSTETVKTHVGNILSKLHLAHRNQAVIYALKQGLINLDDLEL